MGSSPDTRHTHSAVFDEEVEEHEAVNDLSLQSSSSSSSAGNDTDDWPGLSL
eukprot:CAMPEP_0170639462 /NCGR_PEP_ID=MMETSP0224-20130122/39666_1 /TAXON_ID=285029 /ORGANISM="Togula jolla, Strain CCCM 725" /LENGTH=51 /DNA_ID=CAMNT_0010969827 /DNA_START=42 /DNA_END=194 /DNA_ORIENTATION=-